VGSQWVGRFVRNPTHGIPKCSLLELVLLGVLPVLVTEIELVNLNTEYKIKEILDYKQVRNYIKYLVK
jgi:hypothetical protein